MPYLTRKRSDKHCVFKESVDGGPTGDSLGCHDTQEQARDQIIAIELSESNRAKIITSVRSLTDAPNLRTIDTESCANCRFTIRVSGDFDPYCTLFEFETRNFWVCDSWEAIEENTGNEDQEDEPSKVQVVNFSELTGRSWRNVKADDLAITSNAGSIKALGDGRIGGLGLRFGSPQEKDLEGTHFDKRTNYGPSDGDGMQVLIHHGVPLAPSLKVLSDHILGEAKVVREDVGLFVEAVLDLGNEYERAVYDLAERGKLKWSSGTAYRMVRVSEGGYIGNWPIIEWSLTPAAAEYRLPAVLPLKSYIDSINGTSEHNDAEGVQARSQGATQSAGFEQKASEMLASIRILQLE